MPFGLNIAPRIFTKLAGEVVKQLRLQGVNLVTYLDDGLVWAVTVEECNKAVSLVLTFLQNLGFLINWKQSRLTPQTTFQWLGLKWDLKKQTLSIPSDKR